MAPKAMIIPESSKEWLQYWGTKAQVFEKRLLTKADGFPASFVLRRFPVQKLTVQEGGYAYHAHPTTEIGFLIKGRGRTFIEGLGEVELTPGSLLCIPAGTKHAALAIEEEHILAVVNIPAYEKPIGPQAG